MKSSPTVAGESLKPENRRPKPSGQFGNLAGLFLIFFVTTAPNAMRGFWYDELFSYHMSQLPSTAAVWKAMMGGADFNPPLGYMITRAFQAVLGNGELATRLPEVLGYFVMSLCLYRFVTRHAESHFGYVALLLPWCSGAYVLATEARPYGLMLAFAGLALVCWQEAAERTWRGWFIAGFTLSLVAALLTHCYAVLILVPFGLAEIVRQYRARRFDWMMWAALIAPTACVALYIPMMANIKPYVFGNDFFRVHWTALPESYQYFLSPAIWPIAAGALLLSIPRLAASPTAPTQVRLHEWTVAGGFAILPAMAVILAKGMGSQFFPRYAAPGVLGLSLFFALYIVWRGTPARTTGWIAAAFLVCHLVGFGRWLYPLAVETPSAERASLETKERRQSPFEIRKDLPFVVASGIRFFELDHYGSPQLQSRLYYLRDRDTALEYTQSDIFDTAFPKMKNWFPMHGHLAQYQQFVREHPRFLVFGNYHFPNDWLFKKLIDDGAALSLITDGESTLGDLMLFEVNWKAPAGLVSGN